MSKTDLVFKPQALHVVHVSIAVEQITLQCRARLLQTTNENSLNQISRVNNMATISNSAMH